MRTQIAPALSADLTLVARPRLEGVDRPVAADLPAFVERLAAAIEHALDAPAVAASTAALQPFTWGAVFERVERLWRGLLRKEST